MLKRLANSEALSELCHELKLVTPSLGLGPELIRSKKRLLLTEHLADANALRVFLEVWERFDKRQELA